MRARLIDVRAGEHRAVAIAFVTLLLVMTAHAILETARDTLFLAHLPAARLPWVYLAIAALAAALGPATQRMARRRSRQALLSSLLAAAGAVTAGFWLLGARAGAPGLYALYAWSGLLATTVVVAFWLLVADVFTVAQARRLFPLVGAGGVVGAALGSAVASVLVSALPPRHLLAAAALLLVAAAGVPAGLAARAQPQVAEPPRRRAGVPPAASALGREPYLRRLLLLTVAATVTVTIVDFIFKSVVAASVPHDQLGELFALVYTGLNLVALAVQLFAAPWLLRVLGVNGSLLVLPASLLVCSVGFVALPGLIPLILLKGADGTLRYSLHRTASEILYLPLPTELRNRVKGLIESIGQRGGQALASVGLLAAMAAGAGTRPLAWATGVLALLWIAALAGTKKRYLALFREQLRAGAIDTRVEMPDLDLHSLETLLASLNSSDEIEVVAALDMLAAQGRARVIPTLILYHPSSRVVLTALDVLTAAGRTDILPAARRLLEHADVDVSAAALRAYASLAADDPLLRRHLAAERPELRATALVAMVAAGRLEGDEAEAALHAVVVDGGPEARLALVRAIRQQPARADRFDHVLLELCSQGEPALAVEVAGAVEAAPDPKFLPLLLPMLDRRDTRPAARNALVAVGRPGLAFLDARLSDRELAPGLRRHLPRTISRFPAADASPVLQRHLAGERDGMVRFKILRGLGRLHTDHPELPVDRALVRRATEETLERVIRMLGWRLGFEADLVAHPERRTPAAELLSSLLVEKERNTVERVFRLLDLERPREDLPIIHRGLSSPDAKVRATSRELLEDLLPPELRARVLALVDDLPDAERLERALGHPPRSLDYAHRLQAMVADPSEALRSLAAYHAAELGLDELRATLVAARVARPGPLREVIDHALARLGAATAEAARV